MLINDLESRRLQDIEKEWQDFDSVYITENLAKSVKGKNIYELKSKVEVISTIKKFSGCYVMLDENKTILYVGKSSDLRSRLKGHLTENDNNTKYYIQFVREIIIICTSHHYGSLEMKLIRELTPMFNGPNGNNICGKTLGGYQSFYNKRIILEGLEGDVDSVLYKELVEEWHAKFPNVLSCRNINKVNYEEEEGCNMITINLSDVKELMAESDFDKLVLKKLMQFANDTFEGDDTLLIEESINRVILSI